MLKQSKIWQRGKPKFDTSQADGRVAILSAERAGSRVSAAAKFMFAPILILTATLVMKSSYQNIGPRQAKTNTNKYTLIGSQQVTARERMASGLGKGGPKMQPPNWRCIVQNPKFSTALTTIFNQARSKIDFFVLVWKMHVVSHFGPRKLYRHLIKFALLI